IVPEGAPDGAEHEPPRELPRQRGGRELLQRPDYATISVITPPVCVAVFVAAGIAQTDWLRVAREALKLGAVTYLIPFMFIAYPGMLAGGSWIDLREATVSGLVFTLSFSMLFGGARLLDSNWLNGAVLLAIAGLSIFPTWYGLWVATAALVLLSVVRRDRLRPAAEGPAAWREGPAEV